MSRHKAPTIAEQGGLEAHMTSLGASYKLFRQLRGFPGQTYSTIAGALTKDRGGKKIWPSTVKGWCTVDDEEQAAA